MPQVLQLKSYFTFSLSTLKMTMVRGYVITMLTQCTQSVSLMSLVKKQVIRMWDEINNYK